MSAIVARSSRLTPWAIRLGVLFMLVAVGMSFSPTPTARAASTLGALRFNPANGTATSAVTVDTTAPCPNQAKNIIAKIYGSGFPADGANVVGNTAISAFDKASSGAGLSVPLQNTLKFFADAQPQHFDLVGTYRIVVTCRLPFGTTTFGDFTGTLVFGSPNSYVAQQPAAVASPTPSQSATTSVSPSPTGAAASQAVGVTSAAAPQSGSATAAATGVTVKHGSGSMPLIIGIAVAAAVGLAAWLLSTFRRPASQAGRRRTP